MIALDRQERGNADTSAVQEVSREFALKVMLRPESEVALARFQREGELTARLAYVDFDGAKALFASTQVPLEEPLPDTFLDAQCYNCTEAIRRVASWLGE